MASSNSRKEIPYVIPQNGYTWNPNKKRYEVYVEGEFRGIGSTAEAAAKVYEEARKK